MGSLSTGLYLPMKRAEDVECNGEGLRRGEGGTLTPHTPPPFLITALRNCHQTISSCFFPMPFEKKISINPIPGEEASRAL